MARRESYYDIDDILTEAELVPVVFTTSADSLAWLNDHATSSDKLEEGSAVRLPFWLAEHLARKGYVVPELPKMLQPSFREMLMADATVVDLHAKCSYFFEFGIKYAHLVEGHDIGRLMTHVMNDRYKVIVRRTANRKQSESVEYIAKLSNMEKKMFESKSSGLLQFHKLMNRSAIQLTLAPVLASLQGYSKRPASATPAAASRPALQNITNGAANSRNAAAASAAPSSSRRNAPSLSLTATKPAATTSTLAQLSAINAVNAPLQSHEKRRFGMAATQQREQERLAGEKRRAADASQAATSAAAAAASLPVATSARQKRKNVSQNQ